MTPILCGVRGVALYFFASVEAIGLASDVAAIVVAALALDAREPDFRHSLALWPDLPQNMHRPWSNLRLRSSVVLSELLRKLGSLTRFLLSLVGW